MKTALCSSGIGRSAEDRPGTNRILEVSGRPENTFGTFCRLINNVPSGQTLDFAPLLIARINGQIRRLRTIG